MDTDTAIHLFGAVVGDDEDGGMLIDEIENLPNLTVDIAVIIIDALVERGMYFVLVMGGIMVFP